jgi:drug/metabolite transporter (DMT)-like permease
MAHDTPLAFARSVAGRLWGQAYPLLALTALMWGGNAVAGRLAVGEISPMALTCLRWVIVVMVLFGLQRREIAAALPVLRPRWRLVVAMSALGFTGFNALFYAAAHRTTAVNIAILQGAIPVLVLIGTVLIYRTRIRPLQILGMAVTLAGAAAVAAKGDLAVLRSLAFNAGDLWMMIACLFYAGYTLGLRRRPPVPGLALFGVMALVAFLTSLPLLAFEILRGDVVWPGPAGLAVLLYVGLFPSLIAQLFFMRGVELIGPGRAGIFVNLVPVFGSLLAVLVLGEPFAFYHAAGLALVIGGIALAERRAN